MYVNNNWDNHDWNNNNWDNNNWNNNPNPHMTQDYQNGGFMYPQCSCGMQQGFYQEPTAPTYHEKPSLTEEVDDCAEYCEEMLEFLASQEMFGNEKLIKSLMDTVNICDNQIHFILTKSDFCKPHAKLCGEICEHCGKELSKYHDMYMQECGHVCMQCAKSCFDFANR